MDDTTIYFDGTPWSQELVNNLVLTYLFACCAGNYKFKDFVGFILQAEDYGFKIKW